MEKFIVLKNNRIFLSWLGIFANPRECSTSLIAFCIVATLLILVFVCDFCYVIANWSIDVKLTLGAFKIAVAGIQSSGMFLSVKFKVNEIRTLHRKFQEIVDNEIDNIEINNIYWANEQKCRKYAKLLGSYVFIHVSMFIIVLIYALVCISTGVYDTSLWHLFLFTSLPFKSTHLTDWFATWFIPFSMAFIYSAWMTSVTSYFLCCCFYIDTMCKHFNLMLNSINEKVEIYSQEENAEKNELNRVEIAEKLCKAIQFHNEIFDTFRTLANIFTGGIFYLLPINVILVSVSMYDLEVSVSQLEAWLLIWDISCTLCGLLWPTIICYFATFATDRISSLGNMIYESNWYEYPPELQKYMILIIARSQESVYFNGFGLIRCTLEMLGKLLKTSCSFYIIFRTFAKR